MHLLLLTLSFFCIAQTFLPPLLFSGTSLPTSSLTPSSSGTLIVTYQTHEKGKDRLDRIRFWLKEEKQKSALYPKGIGFSDNLENQTRKVVIENLVPGNYTLEFLIPNIDGLFAEVPIRTFHLASGELVKINQEIKLSPIPDKMISDKALGSPIEPLQTAPENVLPVEFESMEPQTTATDNEEIPTIKEKETETDEQEMPILSTLASSEDSTEAAMGLMSSKVPLSEAKPDRSIAVLNQESMAKATTTETLDEIKPVDDKEDRFGTSPNAQNFPPRGIGDQIEESMPYKSLIENSPSITSNRDTNFEYFFENSIQNAAPEENFSKVEQLKEVFCGKLLVSYEIKQRGNWTGKIETRLFDEQDKMVWDSLSGKGIELSLSKTLEGGKMLIIPNLLPGSYRIAFYLENEEKPLATQKIAITEKRTHSVHQLLLLNHP